MIVTVTPNPSLDRTLEVDALARGALVRVRAGRLDAGGKGLNVARALAVNGHEVTAVIPVGGPDGAHLAELVAAEGISLVAVPVARPVRSNVSVVEPDGTVTKLDSPGPELSGMDAERLLAAAVEAARGAAWVACCGSLPPGLGDDFWARVVAAVHDAGARAALDTSGQPLLAALPAGPDVVKPNLDELAEAVGRPVAGLDDVVAAAAELRGRGAVVVLASMGAGGAVLAGPVGILHGEAPVAVLRSPVGAGDALLAGYVAAGGGPEGFAEGMAWAAAACAHPGSALPRGARIDREAVRVREVAGRPR